MASEHETRPPVTLVSNGTQAEPAPSPGEWRTGWRLLLASFLGAALTALPINTVGVFMAPLSAEFGWSQSEISLVIPLNGWTIAITAPFIGHLVDRFGGRRFGIAGAIGLSCAVASLSLLTPSVASYWFAWGLIALAQITGNIMIWTVLVARHFSSNRGAALAVVLLGSSLTGILYAPLASLAIAAWGWRWAYAVSGLAYGLLVIPVVLAYFRDPGSLSLARQRADTVSEASVVPEQEGFTLADAARTRQFWLLAFSILFGAGTAIGLFVLMIPISLSRGLTQIEAALMVSAIGVGSVMAKLVLGPLIDRVRATPLAALTMLGPMATCLIFLFVHPLPYPLALAASFLVGIATGLEIDMIGVVTARYFGLRQFGRIYGAMLCAFQIAAGSGAVLLGTGYDLTGDYRLSLFAGAVLLAASSVLMLLMGRERYPNRRRMPDNKPMVSTGPAADNLWSRK